MDKKRLPLILLGIVIVLALLAFCIVTFGNPQWHWRLYAHQARNAENGLLEPGGVYTGPWNNWNKEGRLLSAYNYRNGLRHGPYVTYDRNGATLSEGQYVDGKLDGVQRINQEGGARTEVIYVNGKRDGVERSWHPNGQLAIEAPWVNDAQEGSVTFYSEEGVVQATVPYYNGKIEGVQKTWYEDGKPQGEETYRNNALNGVSQFFLPNGDIYMKFNYVDGKMNGVQLWNYPSGGKQREATFSQGIPNGPWKEWNEAGELIRDEMYDMGELVKPEKNEAETAKPDPADQTGSSESGPAPTASSPAPAEK